jgi:hypothetical protein
MKKYARLSAVFLMLAAALLLTSCAGVSGGEKSASELINEKIGMINTDVNGFYEVSDVCRSINEVFNDIEARGNTDGVYVDQLLNKVTGFYNTYQLMTEEADEAISVIGSIFSAETSGRVTQLLLEADRNGALRVDEDEFLDILSVISQDYSAFTALDPENAYFTVEKYSYADFAKKVETALFSMNSAFDYYGDNSIDTAQKLTEFKRDISDSLNAMADIAKMHAETLDIMSRDGETVLTLIDRKNEHLPDNPE